MQRGEIYLASFPFGDVPAMKLRPVLLLSDVVGPRSEIVTAYITSVQTSQLLESDLLLDPSQSEHAETKLKTISVLRLHKVATLHHSSLARYIGKIPDETQAIVDEKLRHLLRFEIPGRKRDQS